MESNQLRIRIGLISAAVVLVIFIITRMKACEDQLLEGYVLKEQQKLVEEKLREAERRKKLRWCAVTKKDRLNIRTFCGVMAPVVAQENRFHGKFKAIANVGSGGAQDFIAYTVDLKKNKRGQYVGTAVWPKIMDKKKPSEVFSVGATSEVTCERGVNEEGEDLWMLKCKYKIVKGWPHRLGEEGQLWVYQTYPG